VHGDVLAQIGGPGRLRADPAHRPGDEGVTRDLSGEEPRGRSDHRPVFTEQGQQPGREHHVAVVAPLALADAEDHAFAVDVVDAQRHDLRDPQPGGVGGHEEGAVLDAGDDLEEPGDFLEAEDDGELLGLLGAGDARQGGVAAEGDLVEEAEGGDGLVVVAPGDGRLVDEVDEVGADLVMSQEFGRLSEVGCEGGDPRDVDLNGPGCEVAELEVFDHSLAQGSHDVLLGLR
jgi:hypothetical protein